MLALVDVGVLVVENGQLGLDGVQHQLVHLVDGFEVLLYAVLALQGIVLVFSMCSGVLFGRSEALSLKGILLYLVSLSFDQVELLNGAQLFVLYQFLDFAGVSRLGLASDTLLSELAEVVTWRLAHRSRTFHKF